MKKYNKGYKTIRQKLSRTYGGLITVIISLLFIFDMIMISQFKNKGIDELIQNQIEHLEHNINESIRNSTKQHLIIENDKLIAIARENLRLVEMGYISETKAETFLIQLISESTMGELGYSYAINSRGIMIAHPVESYRGKDYSSDRGIQNQLERQQGFIEYEWKNPGEERARRKMLYMSPLEPLGWVISTTVYTDDSYFSNLIIDEIKTHISEEKSSSLEDIVMLDGKGNILVNTENRDKNISAAIDGINRRMEEIKISESGRMSLPFDNKRTAGPKAIIYYTYLEEMDWIVAGIAYESTLYKPVTDAYLIMVAAIIISFSLFFLINKIKSAQITRALTELINIMDLSEGGDLSVRAHIKTGDEIEILGEHFNRFMQSNQVYINNLNEARTEIRTLAKFPDDNPNPVFRLDSKKRIEYANIKAQEFVLEPLGLGLGDTISEELHSNFVNTHTLSGRNEVEIGEKIFSFSISFVHDPEGIYFYGKDISKQKKFESLQLLSENIFSNSIEGIVITNSMGIIESVNPAFTKITGYTKEEAIGKNPRILKSHRHSREFYSQMWEQLHEKGFWSGEIWNRRKNGSVYPEYLTITSIKNEKGEVNQFISFFHDLSAVKEREDRIAYESTHDKLTGLPNRDFLVLETERLIKNAEAVNEGFSFIYIDINNFKRINESIGPESGDLILIEASKRLDELFKNANSVIRIGGDEFVCILTGKTEAKEISYVLEDIIGIFKPAFYAGGREINLEITLGVSTFPYDDIQPLELLAKAEAAMRASKKDINSPYIFYSPSFRKEGLSRLEIESGLKTAFENQRFYLNYQPKVSALTGKIIGSEALVRLKPIEGQFIGPDIFIPVAEEIGLIEPLGAWVLEKACQDTKNLIEKGFPRLHVAVNLSPWQFRNAALSDQVSNIIASTGIPAANLNLEITESMAIDDVEESIRMMRKLTNIGLTLSIDDFGTGYSSLSYLSSFPVNVLKIDKAFVDGIPEDPKKTGVVLAILSLASNLGMETVAEGVEKFEQYQFLKDRGCTMIQGYYFHKPLLIGDFEKALRKEI